MDDTEWVVIERVEGNKVVTRVCDSTEIPEGWTVQMEEELTPEEWKAKHLGKRVTCAQLVEPTGTGYKHAHDENGNNIRFKETTRRGQKQEIANALYKSTGHEWDIVD